MDNNRMTMDNELRIVQGNTFATAIEIHAVDATGQSIADWSLQDSTDLRVWYVLAGREQDITTWQIIDGKLVILWLANMQRVGTYDIFCAGKYNGADWRNAMQYQFSIVRFNHEANIPANVVILDGVYQLSAELQIITQFQGGGGGGTPSQTLPLMDGEASVGTETAYARGDHRHPSDTSKQDVIKDLATIRSGAAAGATAYQKPSTGIPKSDLSSAVQTSLGKADTSLQAETEPLFTASPAHGITSEDISEWNAKSDFSGSYNDLTNKPTIPAAQVNSDWNASSGVAQILNKPTIPTALSQLSEDTTHRVVTDTEKSTWNSKTSNIGTITGINMNGASKGTSGVVDLGTVITAHQDISGKADKSEMSVSTSGDQTTITLKSGTSATVINSHQSLSGKQDTLVSGTNIKTINGNSVLGNGNISTLTPIVNHGTSDTTYAVTPNVLHIWGTVASLTLTLATPTDATIVNEYMIEFTSGSTATTLSLPASVGWGNRDPLTGQREPLVVQADAAYQISIVNNIGLWAAISNS